MAGALGLGLDFGTESVRALLADVSTGEEVAQAGFQYPHGVIERQLPGDAATPLLPDWFLQDPRDYLAGLAQVVPAVLRKAHVPAEQVVGVGLDFTSCSVMPVDSNGTPLCCHEQFEDDPQAWVKLWKHHGAAAEALHIQQVAERRGERFMDYYAHAVSSEWLLPKVLETRHRSPRIYEAAHTFVEGADWIPWQLTGKLARNACCAGFKAMYLADLGGYPSPEFLEAVEEGLGEFYETKMMGPVVAAGEPVGELTPRWAERLGLSPGTPVSAGMIDAHMGVPGVGITEAGRMALVLGTSFCQLVLDQALHLCEGPLGIVKDGVISGCYAYEAGQSAGGDIYGWFVENCVPEPYWRKSEERGSSLHEVLTAEAERLAPGESGLLALDWWNGNRSILMDAALSGLLVGATLNTRPAEIYRALIEATAFGTRRILDAFQQGGIEVRELIACGGLPEKNPFVVQVLADVCKMPIGVAGTGQAMALGAAMCAAAAAGPERGGHASVQEAAHSMAPPPARVYSPRAEAAQVYEKLYGEYSRLYAHFGRRDRLMHNLRQIQAEALRARELT